jgi:hypothetical protein
MSQATALFVLVSIAACAFGQAQSSAGNVRGAVLDPAGHAVVCTRASLADASRGFSRETRCDAEGQFGFPLVPPGRYRVTVESPGFAAKAIDGVEVRVGDTVSLSFELVVGAIQQVMEVNADPPVVETERSQQANTIELARIRDLPINRRNYLDFVLLAPGTSDTSDTVDGADYRVAQTPQSGISFGGGNGRGNNFTIDGVENYINSGGVRLSVSQEAVQEFQINRNGAGAEFGWASGGTVNIITKSGTNQLRGNLFAFLRHRDIQARNFFDPRKSAFTRSQAGGTLGGPLRKDRSFLFLAYERLDRQETAFVPILQDRSAFNELTPSQRQLADFFDVSGIALLEGLSQQMKAALTPGLNPRVVSLFNRNSGTFPFSEDTQNFSLRLDHRLSDRHQVYSRFNISTSDQQNSQFGALVAYDRGRSFKQWDATGMLSDSLVLGRGWVVDTRLMYNYNTLRVVPTDPFGPELNITGAGFFGRDIFLPANNYERHYQVLQNWNLHHGSHDFKFGADLNPVSDNVISETFFSGRFSFGEAVPLANVLAAATGNPSAPQQIAALLQQLGRPQLVPNLSQPVTALQSFSLGLPTFYQQGFGDPRWAGWTKRYAFYAQDAWHAARGLMLNFGVRYDLEINEKVLGADNNNFSPRFGFAWSPGGSQTAVIRGGYGLFYAPTNLQIANVADTLSGRYINQVFVPLTGVPGINNPQTGRPATSADIYQGLLSAGVIGARTITPQDIASFGVRVGPGLPLRVEFGADPIRQAYSQQGSLEIEKAVAGFAMSAAYNYNRTLGVPRITGRNLYYTGRTLAIGLPEYGYLDPLLLQNNIFTFDGNSNFHAGIFQVQRRMSSTLLLQAHYTWSKAIDDVTDFNSDFSPMDQLNKRAERALSAFHQSHRFVLNALYQSPLKPGRGAGFANNLFGGWTIAPIVVANSWRPFNVLTGVDINGDRYVTNDRPAFAGRNIGQGPKYVTADLRLARRFALGDEGRRTLEFIAEGFNLANRANFRTVNNTVGPVPLASLPNPIRGQKGPPPTVPLAYTSAFDPRQFQFGLKLNF